ncbi:MAG: DNA adenine methylase [Candidatus Aenigmarchaeota archaeon]|nr:DNA adenine methylase [Candidatus Aenigmarchaeota archaeon]
MKDFHNLIEYKPELRELATFTPNKISSIYNWFYYKEGFSKQLVEMILKDFDVQKEQVILDPFCGSGTTLLACKQNNINAIGFDVLPISVFASKVKTQDYNIEELRMEKERISKTRFEMPSPEKIHEIIPIFMKKYFSKFALEDIVFLTRAINGTRSEDIRDFFKLALVNTAMKISYAWKDGAVLKVKRHPTPPMRKMFKRVVENMIKDVKNHQSGESTIEVRQCDARTMDLNNESINVIITSPPYYNNIDYTKIYEIENWFVRNIIEKKPLVRSFIGVKEDFDMNVPERSKAYFKDMKQVIQEMHRVLKAGGKAAIVIGNGYDAIEGVVESDIILSEIAEDVGFSVTKIISVTERAALVERTKKVGSLRESIILMEK